jgi:hypothetical protein
MRKRTRSPLIGSVALLRIIATGITTLSLVGMNAYAADHLRNTAAPLQPAAAQASTPKAATTTTASTGRLQLSRGVATTTVRPVTSTHSS